MNSRLTIIITAVSFLLLLLAGCSSDAGSASGDVTPGCTTDDECPSGYCDDGTCVSILSGDATLEDVISGTKDSGGTADTGREPEPDLGTAEDLPTSPPEDNVEEPPTGEPEISVDPLQHTFTYMPGVDNPQTKTVTIFNEGELSLNITKIEWKEYSSPEFTFMALPPLPKKLNPYEQTAVTVVFKEKSPHGPAYLLVHSDDPDEPVVETQFNSQSKTGDEPCIQILPGKLNFGQVVRGDKKSMEFQIVNCSSNLPLTITKVDRSKFFGMPLTDEFQIEPMPALPLTIAGNQASVQHVTYAPGLAGVDNGHFAFTSNDPALPTAKLDVYGVGVPPPLEEIGLHIELEWDQNSCDVDLHLLKPNATLFDCDDDCYYANMNPDWGTQGDTIDDPFLDYDDVDGYGPENTNLSEPQPGTYKVAMHYYNDSYEGWGGGSTKAIVRVYSYGQLLQEFGPKTLEYTDKTWDVCLVDWPGANITPLDNIYMAPDQPMCLPW